MALQIQIQLNFLQLRKENVLENAKDFEIQDEEYEYNLKYFKEKEEKEKKK